MGNHCDTPPFDSRDPLVETGFADDDSLTEAVVRALTVVEDAELNDLPPLYNAVDPEELDNLFNPLEKAAAADLTVEFSAVGYEVHVTGNGEIVIFEKDTD